MHTVDRKDAIFCSRTLLIFRAGENLAVLLSLRRLYDSYSLLLHLKKPSWLRVLDRVQIGEHSLFAGVLAIFRRRRWFCLSVQNLSFGLA